MTTLTRRTVLATAATLPLAPAMAQQQPGMTTLVVPFPPGGSTDALARQLQVGLQARLGRTIVVENKPGAAGALGAVTVAKSPADGSSLLVTFDSHAVIPAILQRPPLDVEKDLAPVLLVGTAPYVIATNAQRPYRTFADVVAAAKEKPNTITYASVGVGTIGHLAMTLLAKRAGIEITHVPYRGGGPAINDIVGGHVDLICGSAALITPQIAGNTIRPIMQTGHQRLAVLKDTQIAAEAGFADFEALAWWGVFAPAGTPQPVVDSLSKAIKDTLSEPAAVKHLQETQQMTLIFGGPQDFSTFFARQIKLWGSVVQDNNIRA
ncbi:tripartite tricarboxylate transporter substrate binding protein [Phreatobacter aquaticus]|uniref:Tripartite tricarboxylate transporter substrate binding protein n=1 Tax=Phreatobacter aquaticus TaxID=2570229 RepID=A0A4D7QD17_9HYPH|nr:tripartite tricarboxylate transporter substrate binding protein [Phreatobacter aquaticus]QCK84435.1 tripartite tricarboxylate transporter substrate binding protein [Phreatobacter aquaticus]